MQSKAALFCEKILKWVILIEFSLLIAAPLQILLTLAIRPNASPANADGVVQIATYYGCYDIASFGVGLYGDGTGSVLVTPPDTVVDAYIEWAGAEDSTPAGAGTSTLTINSTDVAGTQTEYNSNRDWYAWYADIGPNGTGLVTGSSPVTLNISDWDSGVNETNGATITVVYEVNPCTTPNQIQILTGIDYYYNHGSSVDAHFTDLIIYEFDPMSVERTATMHMTHGGTQFDQATCRGGAIWMVAGSGSAPATTTDIATADSVSDPAYGVNGGIEVINDPFTSASMPCTPTLNPTPDEPYEPGHPCPDGSTAACPYRATAMRPTDGGDVGAEWGIVEVDIIIPADTSWVAFQLESEGDQDGESGAWSGGGNFIIASPYATIGDYVWHDTDADGIQDPGESGIQNVTVNLYEDGGPLSDTTTTGVDGSYTFTDVDPGDYYLDFILPSGYSFTQQDQGGDDAIDSDADPTTGETTTTTLSMDEDDDTWDAGMYTAPDLTITKDDGGTTTTPGSVVIYSLDYENVGGVVATGVEINDDVPSYATFNEANSTVGWSCSDGDPPTTTCTYTVGTLAVSDTGSVDIAFNVTTPLPAGVDQLSNTAVISDDGTHGTDQTPADNTSTDTTPINATPDLTITKDDGGVSSVPGDTITYTLTYENVGDQDATGVDVTDTVPTNTTFNSSASTPGWSCVPDDNAGSTCTYTHGDLDVNDGPQQITFAIDVDDPLAAGVTQVSNTAIVADDGANGTDPTPANNTDTDTTPITATPDLTITKDDGGTTSIPGGTISYTLTYENIGNQDATGVEITDTVPAYTTFSSAASTLGWTCVPDDNAGSTCTYTHGDLGVNDGPQQITFAIVVENPLTAGVTQVDNTTVVADDGTNGSDPTPANNTDSDSTPIIAGPIIAILKDDASATVQPGDVISYTLTYGNSGDQNESNVIISDDVPDHTTFNQAGSTPGWSCADGAVAGTTCEYLVGDLNGGVLGLTVTFAVQVITPVPAGVELINNTVCIDGDQSSPTCDTDDTPVDATPDLAITKDDGISEIEPGASTTYTLTIDNVGDQHADANITVSDTIPDHTSYLSSSDSGSYDDGTRTVTWPVFALNVGSQVTRTITVTLDDPIAAGVETIENIATVTHPEDTNSTNDSDNDIDTVLAQPDLVVTKDDAGVTASPGEDVVYTITYQNVGNQNATGVTLTDEIPVNTSFNETDSPVGWTCVPDHLAGSVCTYTIGALAAGATPQEITLVLTVDEPLPAEVTQIENTVVIADDGTNGDDPTPENNTADETTPVEAAPEVVITKDDGDYTATLGNTIVYVITYANIGNQIAEDVELNDEVPAYTSFNTDASSAGWSCTNNGASGAICTYPVGTLSPTDDSQSVEFAVDVIDPPLPAGVNDTVNTVCISGSNFVAACDEDDTPITAVPDLMITKEPSVVTVYPGDEFIYTIEYHNVGEQDATGVVITETVPDYTTYVAETSSTDWDCTDGANAGTECELVVGDLAVAASGTVMFGLRVVDYIEVASVEHLTNVVVIADDGTNGEDPTPENNTDTKDTPLIEYGSIEVHVFWDANNNGQKDEGEPALENVNIIVTDGSGARTISTDDVGNISVSAKPGTVTLQVDSTDPDIPEGADLTTNNAVQGFILGAGEHLAFEDIGYYSELPETGWFILFPTLSGVLILLLTLILRKRQLPFTPVFRQEIEVDQPES